MRREKVGSEACWASEDEGRKEKLPRGESGGAVVVVKTREEPTYAAEEEWMIYRKEAGQGGGWQPQRNQLG